MLLWDMDFAKTPEDRVGMPLLATPSMRSHRILAELSIGKMVGRGVCPILDRQSRARTKRCGRRSSKKYHGGYGPLYQAAYMLGGLQIRALHRELVGSGKMTNRVFHDSVIQQNSIPIELIRAALTDIPLNRNYRSQWKFADPQ